MIPYICIFSIIIILSIISQKINNNKICLFLLILSAVSLSVFGGMRSYNTGTDISVYGKNYYEKAVNANDFFEYAFDENINTRGIKDYGYLLTNYCVSRFSESPTALFIVLQLLTNIPIFYLLYRRRKELSVPFALLIYLCVWYGSTFNMLRQSVALSFLILGFDYYLSGNKKKYIMLAILAFLFHSTVIYVVGIHLLLAQIKKRKPEKRRKTEGIIMIAALVVTLCLPAVVTFLFENNLVPLNLYTYIHDYSVKTVNWFNIDIILNMILSFPILLSYFVYKRSENNNETPDIYPLLGAITSLSKVIISYTDRFSLYFQYHLLTALPEKIRTWRPVKKEKKALVYVILVTVLIVYWYVKYVVQGAHEIMPYMSIDI